MTHVGVWGLLRILKTRKMKKILLGFIAILSLTFISCYKKKAKETDWEKFNLRGKVKSITSTEYKTVEKFGEVQRDSLISKEISKYNDKGNVTEIASYDSDGSIKQKQTKKYNDKENVIEHVRYKSGGALDCKETYRYNKKGILIEYVRYKSDGALDCKETYRYNKKGSLIEHVRYKSGGELDCKETYSHNKKENKKEKKHIRYASDGSLYVKYSEIYKYDKKANLIELIRYKSGGALYWKETYRYNKKGSLIEQARYDSNGSIQQKQTKKYDDKENLISKTDYSRIRYSKIKKQKTIYKYDGKGNKLERVFYMSDKPLRREYNKNFDDKGNLTEKDNFDIYWCLEWKDTYKYNEKGILIEWARIDSDGNFHFKYTLNYVYDSKGNWIKKSPFYMDHNGFVKKTEMTKRKIEYHD